MKNYEKLNLTVENLCTGDVIATSDSVTTGGVAIPWQNKNISENAVEILKPAYELGYPVD